MKYFGEHKKGTLTLGWSIAQRQGYTACHGGQKRFNFKDGKICGDICSDVDNYKYAFLLPTSSEVGRETAYIKSDTKNVTLTLKRDKKNNTF